MATMFKPIPEVVVAKNTIHATAKVTTVFQTQPMQQQQLQQCFKHNTCNSNSYNSISNTTHATATVTTVFQTQPMPKQQLGQCFKHYPFPKHPTSTVMKAFQTQPMQNNS